MGGDERRLLRVSTGVNGIKTPSGSFYSPTALLARREAIAADGSGEFGGAERRRSWCTITKS